MDSCYPCRNYAIVRLRQDGVPSSKPSPMNCQDGTLAQGCCWNRSNQIKKTVTRPKYQALGSNRLKKERGARGRTVPIQYFQVPSTRATKTVKKGGQNNG